MGDEKIRKKYFSALQIILMLLGCILLLISIYLDTYATYTVLSILIGSIGGSLISVPMYDIIVRYAKGTEKDENTKDQMNKAYESGKTSYVLINESNIMNFINIGERSKVITSEYEFNNLIRKKKYKSTTVLIIGTSFRPLSTEDRNREKNENLLREALRNGINFKFVLSDPDSILLHGDNAKKKNIINSTINTISNLKELYNIKSSPRGSIELRLCPDYERLHSFSLFESEDDIIATLDYNFEGDKKCSQMFFYKYDSEHNIKDELLNNIIEHYKDKFNESIPLLQYTPNGGTFKIFICIKKGGNILIKKPSQDGYSSSDIPNYIFNQFKIISNIPEDIRSFLIDDQNRCTSHIRFLKAFQKKENDGKKKKNVTVIYLVGEAYEKCVFKESFTFESLDNLMKGSVGEGATDVIFQNEVLPYLDTIN